jgi:hypothetical protein
MTDQEMRVLVREAIAQHLEQRAVGTIEPASSVVARQAGAGVSHSRFAVPSGPEGSCIIEPSVMCNHCGYCKSYGH